MSSKLKKIGNDTLFIIINDDAEYGKSLVSAHEPYWKESACMELKPGKAIKYRYKKQLAKKSNKDADDKPNKKKKKEGLTKEDVLSVKRIVYSICVVDTPITELQIFDEYLQCMKTNILTDKIFVLSDTSGE